MECSDPVIDGVEQIDESQLSVVSSSPLENHVLDLPGDVPLLSIFERVFVGEMLVTLPVSEVYNAPKSVDSIDHLRYAQYVKLTKLNKPVQLTSLPPTSGAAHQHFNRVYYQVQTWLTRNGSLEPVATILPPAPNQLLNTIFCNCKSGCGSRCDNNDLEILELQEDDDDEEVNLLGHQVIPDVEGWGRSEALRLLILGMGARVVPTKSENLLATLLVYLWTVPVSSKGCTSQTFSLLVFHIFILTFLAWTMSSIMSN
nr:unnamed protein product [Callosobruchus analis]